MADVFLDYRSILRGESPRCELCPGVFGDVGLLTFHYALDHRKPYCPDCRSFLKEDAIWTRHRDSHFPIRCEVCEAKFASEEALLDHVSDLHGLELCRFCETAVSSSDGELGNHMIAKHSTDAVFGRREEPWTVVDPERCKFLCRLCGETELGRTEFVEHFLYRHQIEVDRLARFVNGKGYGFSVLEVDAVREIDLKPFDGSDDGPDAYEPRDALFAAKEKIADSIGAPHQPGKLKVERSARALRSEDIDSTDTLSRWCGRRGLNGAAVELFSVNEREIDYLLNAFSHVNSRTVMTDDLSYDADEVASKLKLACSLCEPAENASKISDMIQHMTKEHSFKYCPPYGCRVCNISCQTYATVLKHIQYEKSEFQGLYICQLCDDEFKSRRETRQHLTVHWDDLKYAECTSPHLGFKCRYCSCLFWGEVEREKHHCQSHYHSHKDQFYKCDYCLTIFSDKIWWTCHHIQEHDHKKEEFIKSNGYFGYKCILCCSVLQNLDSLQQHFFNLHPEELRFYCTVEGCVSKPFIHILTLKKHYKMNHSKPSEVQNNQINCKEFNDVNSEIHSRDQVFKCDICSIEFNSTAELETHKSNIHLISESCMKCSFCGLTFSNGDTYKKHLLTHNGPKYPCSDCSLIFVQKSNLLRHLKLHNAKKLYSCSHCKRKFSEKSIAKSHMRTCDQRHIIPKIKLEKS